MTQSQRQEYLENANDTIMKIPTNNASNFGDS